MPSITGIELGPDSCVLARVRSVAGATEVSALHTIEPSAWPALEIGVAAALREARRRKGFPRRAVVVAWGLSESASPDTPHVRAMLRPVLAAGFSVVRVLTAPEALCALARTRPRTYGEGAAWLALNTHGAALAIVRDGELLYSRVLEWTFSSTVAGPRAEMLQRYSLVAHLAPEVGRGISMARRTFGASVDVAITCGNLPDLRSLTMPLIEELDLEVETLDSTEGLVSTGAARTDRFAESAPALRLAIAAASGFEAAEPRRRRPAAVGPVLRVAAAVVIVGAAGWAGWRHFGGPPAKPAGARLATPAAPTRIAPNVETRPVPPASGAPVAGPVAGQPTAARPQAIDTPARPGPKPAQPVKPAPEPASTPLAPPAQAAASPKPPPAAVQTTPPKPTAPPVQTTAAPKPALPPVQTAARPNPPPPVQTATAPKPTSPPMHTATKPNPNSPAVQTATAPKPTPAPVQTTAASKSPPPPVLAPPAPPPAARETTASNPATGTPVVATKPAPPPASRPAPPPVAAEPAPVSAPPPSLPPSSSTEMSNTSTRAVPARRPTPLRDRVPAVESILISRDRRVAVVDGAIVGVGDSVGSRVVVRIERNGVVLREPSGYELHVSLRRSSEAPTP